MSVVVLLCGDVFDGISDTLTGPANILVESVAGQVFATAPDREARGAF